MIEKIFFNGNILTQDIKKPIASAFAIAEGKIIAVGKDGEILKLQTHSTVVRELNQKTVLPGFNDAHIHIWKVGNLMTYMLDLRDVRSIDEMQQRISDYANQNPDVEWIQARGFNEALFPDKRMPNRYDLDKVISDRPVSVIRICAHQVVANTNALLRAGITKDTSPPSGGEIKFLTDGELAGHFTETAIGLALNKIPPYSPEQYRNMVLAAQDELLQFGITSATDPAVMPDLLEVYKSMNRNGELKIRINAIPVRLPDGASGALAMPQHYISNNLKINTVKFFADGGLSGKTAAMNHPYKNSEEYGVLRLTRKSFTDLALESQRENFRIATHAIGDAAIDLVLEVYNEISPVNTNHINHRIEHLGFPSEKNLQLMSALNISAVMQPIFIHELGRNFREYLTDDYLSYVYPFRQVLDNDIHLAFSTDAPVVKDFNPLKGIQTSVERKDADGYVIGEAERISVEEALHAYTMGSAIANGDEKISGSISPGKWADFTILDKNPKEIPSFQLPDCKVLATYISGHLCYEKT